MGDILDSIPDRIAAVHRALAEMEAHDEAVTRLAAEGRRRRATGSSVVFSLRLDPAELSALEVAAARRDLKPTVLARNLIRVGLSAPPENAVSAAVSRVEEMVQELRAIVQ